MTLSAGDYAAEGSFERTLPVTGPVELDVRAGSGRISVRSGENHSVRIRGAIRARGGWLAGLGDPESEVRRLEADPPVERDGNFIRVGTRLNTCGDCCSVENVG